MSLPSQGPAQTVTTITVPKFLNNIDERTEYMTSVLDRRRPLARKLLEVVDEKLNIKRYKCKSILDRVPATFKLLKLNEDASEKEHEYQANYICLHLLKLVLIHGHK